jgi:hypothetical protein
MKNIKKYALVMIFMIAMMSFSTVSGEEGLKLSAIVEKAGNTGEQAMVTVTAEHAAGLEGGQFILKFDPSLVKPVLIETGSLVADAQGSLQMANVNYGPGQLIFMWVTPYADTADTGVVCTITFELMSEGMALLEFDEIVLSPAGVNAGKSVAGKIAVGDKGVDQVNNEQDNLGQDGAAGELDGNAGSDEDPAVPADGLDGDDGLITGTDLTDTNTVPLFPVGLAVFTVILAAGYLYIKRSKKASKDKNIDSN